MLTSIFVTLKLEGQHNFKGAVDSKFKEVHYLMHPHRHIFGFKVELQVMHDDRDVEFIMFKHEVIDYLKDKYWSETLRMCNFTGQSCEMLGKEIVEYCLSKGYRPLSVEVDEDGENGARVVYQEPSKGKEKKEKQESVQLKMPLEKELPFPEVVNSTGKSGGGKLVFVVGFSGAGKSTVSGLMAALEEDSELIEVSEEIRKLKRYKEELLHGGIAVEGKKSTDIRKQLADSISSQELVEHLQNLILVEGGVTTIISGIRDYEAFKALKERYEGHYKVMVVHIDAPATVRASRLGMDMEDYLNGPGSIDSGLGVPSILEHAEIVYRNY